VVDGEIDCINNYNLGTREQGHIDGPSLDSMYSILRHSKMLANLKLCLQNLARFNMRVISMLLSLPER